MRVIVSMIMSMRVPVAVIVSAMTMIMPVMSMSESKQTHHVNQKPKRTDHQQLLDAAQLSSFQHTLRRFPDELYTDQHEEDAVSEARQRVQLTPTVRHLGTGGPFGSDCSAEANY